MSDQTHMNNENTSEICTCDELKAKYELSVKDNEHLAKMIQNLRAENARLSKELRNQTSRLSGPQSPTAVSNGESQQKYEHLLEINRGWKKDYEQLETRFEMLKREEKTLKEKEKDLKAQISDLEKRQGSLENEVGRLATALYAQQSAPNGGGDDEEEHCEMLKSQILVYKEDFDRERRDREKIHEEKERYKRKVEESEEIIQKLTMELDACRARENARTGWWSENGFLSETNSYSPRGQSSYPYGPVDQEWRNEQQRRGIYPRNRPSRAVFYGGDVEVDEMRA